MIKLFRIALVCLVITNFNVYALEVYLDFDTGGGGVYANFGESLNAAATSAGVDAFTAAEIDQIKTNVINGLDTVYQDFTVNFSTTVPAVDHETLSFNPDPTGISAFSYGRADSIDYRNYFLGENANIFTFNFGDYIDEYSGSSNRTDQISEISIALANTGAHELGHILGMQHGDAYGFFDINSNTWADTGGVQVDTIITTFASGLTEDIDDSRLHPFNPLISAKMEYTFGMTDIMFDSYVVDGGANLATATDIHGLLQQSNYTYGLSANITDFHDAGTVEYFSLGASAGAMLTAQVMMDIDSFYGSSDFILDLVDSSGNVLYTNDDATWDGDFFDDGIFTETLDPFILNYVLPADDTYYVCLSDWNEGGNYEMFFFITPEPSISILIIISSSLAFRRRRKRKLV